MLFSSKRLLTIFINGGYFSILLSVFKFACLASFGLKYSFEFFTQRRVQPGKFEYRQKNTNIAAIYESGLYLVALLLSCLPKTSATRSSIVTAENLAGRTSPISLYLFPVSFANSLFLVFAPRKFL